MKNGIRFLLTFLLVAMVLFAGPAVVSADPGGDTGDCSWLFNEQTRTLYISGSGNMEDYSVDYDAPSWNQAPWRQYCQMIEKVVISDGVTNIGTYAFENLFMVREFSIPGSVNSIPASAFVNSGLQKLRIYNPFCKFVGDWKVETDTGKGVLYGYAGSTAEAYAKAQGLTFAELDDVSAPVRTDTYVYYPSIRTLEITADLFENVQIIWVNGVLDEAVYPWTHLSNEVRKVIFREGVTLIGDQALGGFQSMEEVFIPDTVEVIHHYAFRNCKMLKSIYLPDSVKEMGSGVFADCTALENVRISENLNYLPQYMFSMCSNLKTLVLPGNVEYDRGFALFSAGGIRDLYVYNPRFGFVGLEGGIYLSDTTVVHGYIGSTAEDAAKKLGLEFVPLDEGNILKEKTYTFYPDGGILVITQDEEHGGSEDDSSMKYSWANLAEVTRQVYVKEGVTLLGPWALAGFDNVWRVEFANTVRKIDAFALYRCHSLETVRLRDSITEIGESAFEDCSSLEYITLPAKLTTIGVGTFQNCSSLKSVQFPNVLREINNYAFAITALEEISLPESLEIVRQAAFLGVPLASVEIPKNVVIIEDYAFGYLLEDPYYTGDNAFPQPDFKVYANCSTSAAVDYANKNGFSFESTGGHLNKTTVIKKATPTANGKSGRFCTVCGRGKLQTIKKVSKISLSETDFTYNMKTQRPMVTVKDSGGKTIATSHYSLSWSNKNSKAVGKYYVKVSFKGKYYTGQKTLTYFIIPQQISSLTKTSLGDTYVDFEWKKAPGAVYYLVQLTDGNGKKFTRFTDQTYCSFRKPLEPGTKYSIRTLTYSDSKKTICSEAKSFGSFTTRCAAPKYTLKSLSPKRVTVTISEKVKGAKYYEVYASEKKDKGYQKVATMTALKKTITMKKRAKRYYFKVIAYNENGYASAYVVKSVFVK